MAGTKIGGMKAKAKNLENDPQFYQRIGSKGGRNGLGSEKGFAANHERARLGGQRAKRNHKYLYEKDGYRYYTYNPTGELVRYEIK